MFIAFAIFVFWLTNKGTMFSQSKVFVSKEQCEQETSSKCIHYLCDIPVGDMYQQLCTNERGSGWYNEIDLEK